MPVRSVIRPGRRTYGGPWAAVRPPCYSARMDAHRTQPSLLARLRQSGDAAAWWEFDAKYRELILRYCSARGLQASDGEDVRQIVMLELTSTLRQFSYRPEQGKFRHYLGCIVRHAITRFLGHRQRVLPAGADPELSADRDASAGSEMDALWEQQWFDHHLRLAMAAIRNSHDARTLAVFECLLAGASVGEAAERFSLSEQAVYKVKQRIRDELKKQIAAQIRDEDEPE